MKALGKWSVVSFIRFIVQLTWAVVLVTLAIQFFMLGINLYTGSFLSFPFLVYIEPRELVSGLRELLEINAVTFSSTGEISANYVVISGEFWTTLIISLLQIGLMGFAFYGLSTLKKPLNALALDKVFEPQNSADLKKVALIFLLAAPLKHGYELVSMWYFGQLVDPEKIVLALPPFNYTLLVAGLICYVIAEIVNQATILHEEQKLTV